MCVVAVDFDGTITADYDKARAALSFLLSQGHQVIIWSSRNNPQQHGQQQQQVFKQMIDLLDKHQVPYTSIDDGTTGKLHAQVYIDDKCWRFDGNWDKILLEIY